MKKDWDDLVDPARAALEALITSVANMTDRIEELEAKLASAGAMLEREIRRVQKIRLDLPPPHKVDLAYIEDEYRLMLAELKGEK